VPIYWVCESRDCITGLSPQEQRPHKIFKRKRAALDNGQLDEDDELVVFSELYDQSCPFRDLSGMTHPAMKTNGFLKSPTQFTCIRGTDGTQGTSEDSSKPGIGPRALLGVS
jgi:hypothetical protein